MTTLSVHDELAAQHEAARADKGLLARAQAALDNSSRVDEFASWRRGPDYGRAVGHNMSRELLFLFLKREPATSRGYCTHEEVEGAIHRLTTNHA